MVSQNALQKYIKVHDNYTPVQFNSCLITQYLMLIRQVFQQRVEFRMIPVLYVKYITYTLHLW